MLAGHHLLKINKSKYTIILSTLLTSLQSLQLSKKQDFKFSGLANLPKTQKSKYFENETLLFRQIKSPWYSKGYNMANSSCLAEVTFNP